MSAPLPLSSLVALLALLGCRRAGRGGGVSAPSLSFLEEQQPILMVDWRYSVWLTSNVAIDE